MVNSCHGGYALATIFGGAAINEPFRVRHPDGAQAVVARTLGSISSVELQPQSCEGGEEALNTDHVFSLSASEHPYSTDVALAIGPVSSPTIVDDRSQLSVTLYPDPFGRDRVHFEGDIQV